MLEYFGMVSKKGKNEQQEPLDRIYSKHTATYRGLTFRLLFGSSPPFGFRVQASVKSIPAG